MNREELARKCERVEKAGGSVRDFLAGLGFISPWGTWFRLQKEELGRKSHQITDGKGNEEMKKITLDVKKKAVEIALSGGNPLKYLKEHGAGNASASWAYIKKTLKEADPEKYAMLPTRVNAAEPEVWKPREPVEEDGSATPEIMPENNNAEPVTTCCARSTREGVEVPDELPEDAMEIQEKRFTNPVNYDGFDVMALKSPGTGFRFESDPRYGMMTWRTVSGDEVSMTVEEWRKLADEIPKVLQIFGI